MRPMFRAFLLMVVMAACATSPAGESQTLTGSYRWNQGSSGDLKAVFTPAGQPHHWNVAFHFEFRSRERVWKGTAQGSLGEGTLEGTVLNGSRTFTFRGEFEDGELEGVHAELEDGQEQDTGTLTLKI